MLGDTIFVLNAKLNRFNGSEKYTSFPRAHLGDIGVLQGSFVVNVEQKTTKELWLNVPNAIDRLHTIRSISGSITVPLAIFGFEELAI